MPPKIDPAILKALSLDEANTTISSHGGSGFVSTFKLTTKDKDEKEKLYFVKTGKGRECEIMFAGEHASLNAIHSAVPSLCPTSHAHGPLSHPPNTFFLATDFLALSSSPSSGASLPHKLALLHSTPAPIPPGHTVPQFGFHLPTCCGDTVQDNTYHPSWSTFFSECRLTHILSCAEKNNGPDTDLSSLVQQTCSIVVPRLLRDGHLRSAEGSNITPVLVHGDLWSGNHGRGSIDGGAVEERVFDPSCCWAHSEFEFGIMGMFGGFGGRFREEYWGVKGKDEPVEEWEDRVALYELYHHLNHYSIFGGSYRGGAVRIMKSSLKKYGDGG
ncbi:Ketosamine-3-kinase [Mollisia scopiformis]|uniref:protein-ribulosamine 3-kinase n=1 Tax=Mollisia scopiformis TaxID=149040 RepID=A0A132B861_MOLSC|nr:Ketosamine-3-kinase [Mollisia scopiformis]KUJ08598.1 Ketosamine-3-kinase [Mollisia scopiformis]